MIALVLKDPIFPEDKIMSGRSSEYSNRNDVDVHSWLKIALICLLLLGGSVYSLLHQYSVIFSESRPTSRSFILVITIRLENTSPQGKIWNLSEKERTIGLFMNNTWQTVYLLNSSCPLDEVRVDEDGNLIAILSTPISKIPCGENFTFQVAYRIIIESRRSPQIIEEQSGDLGDISKELKRRYCRSDGPWQVDDENLRRLAFEIAGNETNVLSILKRFINWIKCHIYYKSQDLPKYPTETLRDGVGDCDDQANLLITFCRIIGIPAYLQVGCIYLPRREIKADYWKGHWMIRLTRIGWHGWAIVYVPPWGWMPVDLTFAPGIFSDPLNAIRNAALIRQATIQYANITRSDYIASSRDYRRFIISNEFRIYEHDILLEENIRPPRLPRIYMPILSVNSEHL